MACSGCGSGAEFWRRFTRVIGFRWTARRPSRAARRAAQVAGLVRSTSARTLAGAEGPTRLAWTYGLDGWRWKGGDDQGRRRGPAPVGVLLFGFFAPGEAEPGALQAEAYTRDGRRVPHRGNGENVRRWTLGKTEGRVFQVAPAFKSPVGVPSARARPGPRGVAAVLHGAVPARGPEGRRQRCDRARCSAGELDHRAGEAVTSTGVGLPPAGGSARSCATRPGTPQRERTATRRSGPTGPPRSRRTSTGRSTDGSWCASLLEAIDHLPSTYADVVRMRDLDERPVAEVPQELHISRSNVACACTAPTSCCCDAT